MHMKFKFFVLCIFASLRDFPLVSANVKELGATHVTETLSGSSLNNQTEARVSKPCASVASEDLERVKNFLKLFSVDSEAPSGNSSLQLNSTLWFAVPDMNSYSVCTLPTETSVFAPIYVSEREGVTENAIPVGGCAVQGLVNASRVRSLFLNATVLRFGDSGMLLQEFFRERNFTTPKLKVGNRGLFPACKGTDYRIHAKNIHLDELPEYLWSLEIHGVHITGKITLTQPMPYLREIDLRLNNLSILPSLGRWRPSVKGLLHLGGNSWGPETCFSSITDSYGKKVDIHVIGVPLCSQRLPRCFNEAMNNFLSKLAIVPCKGEPDKDEPLSTKQLTNFCLCDTIVGSESLIYASSITCSRLSSALYPTQIMALDPTVTVVGSCSKVDNDKGTAVIGRLRLAGDERARASLISSLESDAITFPVNNTLGNCVLGGPLKFELLPYGIQSIWTVGIQVTEPIVVTSLAASISRIDFIRCTFYGKKEAGQSIAESNKSCIIIPSSAPDLRDLHRIESISDAHSTHPQLIINFFAPEFREGYQEKGTHNVETKVTGCSWYPPEATKQVGGKSPRVQITGLPDCAIFTRIPATGREKVLEYEAKQHATSHNRRRKWIIISCILIGLLVAGIAIAMYYRRRRRSPTFWVTVPQSYM